MTDKKVTSYTSMSISDFERVAEADKQRAKAEYKQKYREVKEHLGFLRAQGGGKEGLEIIEAGLDAIYKKLTEVWR